MSKEREKSENLNYLTELHQKRYGLGVYKMDEITKIYQSLNSDPGQKEGKARYDSIPSLYRV